MQATEILERIRASVASVLRGQDGSIRTLLAAFAADGHVLLEDVPGTGKTTLAKALARTLGATFRRIQFTPDLLPSDIVGVSIFDPKDQSFHFHQGPIFSNVLLADEINRASPRTQSALLEAMAEGQVTIDGETHPLRDLFFVIATQNPIELAGTYPLPEAQMDRFAVQFSPGYVSPEDEVAVLSAQEHGHPLAAVEPCVSLAEILEVRRAARAVRVSDEIKRYIVDLVTATRTTEGVSLGASPRASIALMRLAQATALLDERPYVGPDEVRELAPAVIAHRLVLAPQARFAGLSGRRIVVEILERIPVPT